MVHAGPTVTASRHTKAPVVKHRYLNERAQVVLGSTRIDSHHMEKITKLIPQLQPYTLQHQVLVVATTAALSLTAAAPLRAATQEPAKVPKATAPESASASAQQCLTDLSAFHGQMRKDGYWRGASGYGYGYPMYGYGYAGGMLSPAMTSANSPTAAAHMHARPGYEVRTLLAATQILAQRGQQASCEALLGETRKIYDRYAAEMRSGNLQKYDAASFRQAQLATAESVAGQDVSYRSDQLIGTEVLNPKGEELGSVDDVVHSPKTGKIAYLVIGRGGLFGINEKYVPVPWTDFKATTGAKMLVLDSTKVVMSAAPQVKEDRFSPVGDFDKQSQLVDAYWSSHLAK
jgi:sporulation protein YlmC with PRC-barrel domain